MELVIKKYPLTDFAANKLKISREPIGENAVFLVS
jgi:hypothetical protein